jgi:8-oxo-dGTP pyrophosphatase MutT (NUDIX family)
MLAHPGQWALPGGRTDDGETTVAAALREME